MKSMGAEPSLDLKWLDLKIEHQDDSPSDGHQGVMLHCSSIYNIVLQTTVPRRDLTVSTLLKLDMEYSGFGTQYQACWCPGS